MLQTVAAVAVLEQQLLQEMGQTVVQAVAVVDTLAQAVLVEQQPQGKAIMVVLATQALAVVVAVKVQLVKTPLLVKVVTVAMDRLTRFQEAQ
jgi:hypothetical protein